MTNSLGGNDYFSRLMATNITPNSLNNTPALHTNPMSFGNNNSLFTSPLGISSGDSFQRCNQGQQTSDAKTSAKNNAPIGQAEMSDSEQQIIEEAIQAAGVPESITPVAIEHLAAMNKSGSSSSSKNSSTNNTNSNQDKIDKLAEFLEKYNAQFGADGDLSKGEYLKNVSQLAKGDMEAQGKPFIDPASGFFDAKNYSNPAGLGKAFKAVNDANSAES